MKKGISKRLTPAQRTELKSLAARRDDEIDISDAPELLAWFKSHTTTAEGYQTRINRALREYVHGQARQARRSRA